MFAVPNNFCRGFFVEYETEGLFIFLHQSDDVVTSSLFVTKSFSVFVNWKTSNTAKSCSSYLIFSSSAPPILTRPVGWTWTHSRSIVDPPIVIVILIPSPVARNSNTHHNLKKKKSRNDKNGAFFLANLIFFILADDADKCVSITICQNQICKYRFKQKSCFWMLFVFWGFRVISWRGM